MLKKIQRTWLAALVFVFVAGVVFPNIYTIVLGFVISMLESWAGARPETWHPLVLTLILQVVFLYALWHGMEFTAERIKKQYRILDPKSFLYWSMGWLAVWSIGNIVSNFVFPPEGADMMQYTINAFLLTVLGLALLHHFIKREFLPKG